jgi:hypothetical protein
MPGYEQIFIYSLCGTLFNDVFESDFNIQNYVTVYPNPSTSFVSFSVNLPDNLNKYELAIYDSNLNEVKREDVLRSKKMHEINMMSFSNGLYFLYVAIKK